MTTENRVLIAQIVGLAAIISARYGIEINAEAQADIIAGLSAFGLVFTAVLAKLKRPQTTGDGKQAGFITARLACCLAAICVALMMFPACTAQPVSPQKAISAASLMIGRLAQKIDSAQKAGQISNEREDELLDALKRVNADLRLANQLSGAAQSQTLETVNARLIELRAQMAKEQAK